MPLERQEIVDRPNWCADRIVLCSVIPEELRSSQQEVPIGYICLSQFNANAATEL